VQSLPELLEQSTAHAWLFVPTALLLGALHGLEPGHSKTMMAAFIVAVRGTVMQAVLLGLSAALSHTAVVWLVALGGLYLGRNLNAEATEPYFQLGSAVLVFGIALWMLLRTRADVRHANRHDSRHHHHESGHGHRHDGADRHRHRHVGDEATGGHERAHAADIGRRFQSQNVTTGQILMFGLTGGLLPCPAAITVLLLCLQLKQFSLGVVLVMCFSVGLAVTMVTAGVTASLAMNHVQKRWSGFSALARRAPYASSGLMLLVAFYMAYSGWAGLAHS
jgi:nickel/cobalt exporter